MRIRIILLLMITVVNIKAQTRENRPHEFNTRILTLGVGLTSDGLGAKTSFSKVNKNATTSRLELSYDFGENEPQTQFSTIATSFSIMKPIIKTHKKFYTSIGAGGYLGYDMAKNDILDESKNRFSPGVLAKVELEKYIKFMGLFCSFEQLYRPRSIVSSWQWKANAGIRIIIK